MGKIVEAEDGAVATQSLNRMFGTNIVATFIQIEHLRITHPHILNPAESVSLGTRAARRQSLRFAAFLINDEVAFTPNYPAQKFKLWLKWLTWLGTQTGGPHTLDSRHFGGTASQLILKVLAAALPPGGIPSPVHFTWRQSTGVNELTVSAKTSPTSPGFSIDVVSVDSSNVQTTGDEEDDV